MEKPKEYYAFISYKREDEKWAKWLQDKLEHYKFPTNLNGRTDLPKNIRPTFRDVTDLKPGLLAEEINDALRNSEWLIVVCSPRSAKSPWVCKEAQTFIELGRADHIIPFVIEGIPFSKDSATECYPDALLNLTGSKELLGANINEMGRDAAAIKVVARMFNLVFDTLWQRHEREQKKRRRQISAAIVFAFIFLSVIAGWIWHQNVLLKEREWDLMENQARAVAEKAKELVESGDSYLARLLLLEVLPKDLSNPNRPYVPEAEAAIRRAFCIDNTILKGHVYDISSMQFSHDGSKLYTGSWDGSVFFWDVHSGALLKRLYVSSEHVNDIFLSPDDKYLFTASNDSIVRIWDTSSCSIIGGIKENDCVYTIKQSPDGRFIITGTGHSVHIWDLFQNNFDEPYICNNYNGTIHYIAIDKRGRYFTTSTSNNILECRSLFTNDVVWTVDSLENIVTSMDYSLDGRKIMVSSFLKGVEIRNAQTGDFSKQLSTEAITVACLSPLTCKYVAMGYLKDNYESEVILVNSETGQIENTFAGPTGQIRCVIISPDETVLCSGGADIQIRLWDMSSHASFEGKGHSDHIQSISFSHNGKRLVTSSDDKTVRVWNVENNLKSAELFDTFSFQNEIHRERCFRRFCP